MRFKEFREEAEKMGLQVAEKAERYFIISKEKNINFAQVHAKRPNHFEIEEVLKKDCEWWGKNHYAKLIEICMQFATTPLEERIDVFTDEINKDEEDCKKIKFKVFKGEIEKMGFQIKAGAFFTKIIDTKGEEIAYINELASGSFGIVKGVEGADILQKIVKICSQYAMTPHRER